MSLVLPDVVQYNRELDDCLERLDRTRERAGWLKHFDAELRKLDQRLSLVRAGTQFTMPGLVPGYWHVKRRNDPPAMDSYLPLMGPDGEFVEPHMGILENLKRQDLQRDGALDELRKREEREREDQEKAKRFRAADRQEEFATRLKAIENPGVSMAPGWTYRKKGRRGA